MPTSPPFSHARNRPAPAVPVCALAVVCVLAAAGPAWSAAKRPVTPTLDVTTRQAPEPAEPGARMTLSLSIAPPEGILLNRYPGLRLRITPSESVAADEEEVFVGSRAPIEDPDDAYFEGPVPIALEVVAKPGDAAGHRLEGQLRFFYCVKKSGFCAPGRQDVSIPLALARD